MPNDFKAWLERNSISIKRTSPAWGNRLQKNNAVEADEKRLESLLSPEMLELLVAARERYLELKRQLLEKHHVECTLQLSSEQRNQERDRITKHLYGQGAAQKGKRIDIVIGLPGAGKSSRAVIPLAEQYGALVVDSDFVKEQLPEYADGVAAGLVHEESSLLAKMVLGWALAESDNIIYPTVGSNAESLRALISSCKDFGYTVALHLVDLPAEIAVQRVMQRYKETGRFVDPLMILKTGLKCKESFDILIAEGSIHESSTISTSEEEIQIFL